MNYLKFYFYYKEFTYYRIMHNRVAVSPGSLESEISAMAASLSTLAQGTAIPAVKLAKAEELKIKPNISTSLTTS